MSLRSFKTGNCQRITSKNTRPRWVETWARGTVKWYWSADSLFWQLSIDHIDVQLVYFSWAHKVARKCESKHWFACGADGRSPNFSGMGRFTYRSGISLHLRTGPTGHATLFNQWEGALVFINKQIKTSAQWSKKFKTADGVGQNWRWAYSTRLGFTYNISKKTFHVRG